MLAKIQAWINSKNITAHTVAVALITFATAYTANTFGLRDFCLQVFQNHPTIPADILALCGIILKYSHSSSPAGTIATAESVLASPDVPTKSEVHAATVNPNAPAVWIQLPSAPPITKETDVPTK